MTMHIPRIRKTACMGRSTPRDGSLAVRGPNLLLWAVLALLAAIFIAEFVVPSSARADDRKTRVITFLGAGAKTGTAQSTAFDVSAYAEGQLFFDVTSEGGDSTLDIIVQTSPDNATWYTHTTIGQITAIGQTRAAITNFGNYLRIYYVVGGTSFTFSVVGVFKN